MSDINNGQSPETASTEAKPEETSAATPVDAKSDLPEGSSGDEGAVVEKEPELPLTPEQERIKSLCVTVLRTVFDPEIPVNIYEMGLIYAVQVTGENDVKVKFTLTSPNCPAAQDLPAEMERKIKALDGVGKVEMELTWDPTWTPEMMSEAAKLQLNMF